MGHKKTGKVRAAPVRYTYFEDVYARTAERREETFAGFVGRLKEVPAYDDKKQQPLISMALYGNARSPQGSLRHAANVEEFTGVEIEHDAEAMPMEAAHARAVQRGLEAVFYTTARHEPGKPRWRAFFPLSRGATPEIRMMLAMAVDAALGNPASPESFAVSQAYYVGRINGHEYKVLESRGLKLDLAYARGAVKPVARKVAGAAGKWQEATRAQGKARVYENTIEDAARLLGRIDNAGGENWVLWNKCMLSLREFGEEGLALFEAWSGDNDSYDQDYTRRQWKSWLKNGSGSPVTFATLVGLAEDLPDDIASPGVAQWMKANGLEEDAGPKELGKGRSMEEFRWLLPENTFVDLTQMVFVPVASIDRYFGRQGLGDTRLNRNGKGVPASELFMSKSKARYQPLDAMSWAPGLPRFVEGRVLTDRGWVEGKGLLMLNAYLSPLPCTGDAGDVGPWLDLVKRLVPDEAEREHVLNWMAFAAQHPGTKINHAVVFVGAQGIGKDTMFAPLRHAVGSTNTKDIEFFEVFAQFRPWLKSVFVTLQEAADSDKFHSRRAVMNALKPLLATTDDRQHITINEKHRKQYGIPNVLKILITTNDLLGLMIEVGDRRYYVVESMLPARWNDAEGGAYFKRLYEWYADGGLENVRAWLLARDVSGWNPAASPPDTPAKARLRARTEPAEDTFVREALEALGHPGAVTTRCLLGTVQMDDFEKAKRIVDASGPLAAALSRAGYLAEPTRTDVPVGGKRVKLQVYVAKDEKGVAAVSKAIAELKARLGKEKA